jgi:hypothetical protein
MRKPVFSKTARLFILNEIFDEFQQITQWDIRNPDSTTAHLNKAEKLIEILEVDDCGSIGGFDKYNPVKRISEFNQYDRFLALISKYHANKDIVPVCDFSVEDLTEMFKKFSSIRNEHETHFSRVNPKVTPTH